MHACVCEEEGKRDPHAHSLSSLVSLSISKTGWMSIRCNIKIIIELSALSTIGRMESLAAPLSLCAFSWDLRV